ncbi:MAG: hypothetical protein AAB676_07775 [Verrucomicrobiota bacterium]
MRTKLLKLGLLCGCLCLADGSQGIDFSKARPGIAKQPSLVASQPLYGAFLFGTNGGRFVWAILDKSKKASLDYDVLYLDLNADGDLTQPDERFVTQPVAPKKGEPPRCVFEIGRLKDPGTGRAHTDFRITWTTNRVSYRMKWQGDKMMMGGYASDPDSYGNFSSSSQTAPIFVPDYDRPLQFQHWMSGSLKPGVDNDFKVFLGNQGNGLGTFSAVDDKFLPPDDYVIATLVYKNKSGAQHESRFELKRRC